MQPNLKHFHPFGCLVYVLQAPLQTRSPFPKWGECSRIGIFLCHSPHHASSVPLVLSTQTGLVSPQFHCVFDDDFDTVGKEQADMSIWKTKAHLQETKERVTESTTRSSLVSGPKHQLGTSLPPYSRDIPPALQDLSQLLPDAPATEENKSSPTGDQGKSDGKHHSVITRFWPQTPTGDFPSSIQQGHRTGTPRPVPTSPRCPCHRGQ